MPPRHVPFVVTIAFVSHPSDHNDEAVAERSKQKDIMLQLLNMRQTIPWAKTTGTTSILRFLSSLNGISARASAQGRISEDERDDAAAKKRNQKRGRSQDRRRRG